MVITLFIFQALVIYTVCFENIPIWFRVICYIGMFFCVVIAQALWSGMRADVDGVKIRLKMIAKKKKKTPRS